MVLLRLPDDATVFAEYLDDPSTRDITHLTADLILEALHVNRAAPAWASGDQVIFAHVYFSASGSDMAGIPPVSCTVIDAPTGAAWDISLDRLGSLISDGMTETLRKAIEADAGEDQSGTQAQDIGTDGKEEKVPAHPGRKEGNAIGPPTEGVVD